MISSRNLYNVKFNGIELESKLLKTTSEREIATSLNFINLGKYEMSNLCETLMGPLTGDSKMNKQVQF